MHEPCLLSAFCFPILPHDTRFAPWQLKNTELVDRTRSYLSQVQKTSEKFAETTCQGKENSEHVAMDGMGNVTWHIPTISFHIPKRMALQMILLKGKGSSVLEMVTISCALSSVIYVSFGIFICEIQRSLPEIRRQCVISDEPCWMDFGEELQEQCTIT